MESNMKEKHPTSGSPVGILKPVGLFSVGVVAGLAATRMWPRVEKEVKPWLAVAGRLVASQWEQAKKTVWEKAEGVADFVAEVSTEKKAQSGTPSPEGH